MKRFLHISLFLALCIIPASAQSRPVLLTWGASTSTGVVGYNVFRSTSPAGPFTTPLNTTPVTNLTFTDPTAVIGNTYTYAVTAVGVACTPTTPVGTACGPAPQSQPPRPSQPSLGALSQLSSRFPRVKDAISQYQAQTPLQAQAR